MSLEHSIIKPATEAQTHQVILRNAAHWGVRAGVAVEDYVKLSEIFQLGAFARDGRLQTWQVDFCRLRILPSQSSFIGRVLAPEDDPDTTDFYASCGILTREVLTLQPGQTSPTSSFGHVVSGVLVPPEYRGKGYAKRFMSLIHSVLAPHRYPNARKAPTVADHPSTVSVLYSAIGDYYTHCIPSEGESGWALQKSLVTTWPLSNAQIPLGKETSAPIELLSEPDLTAILESDDSHIPSDLLELQKKDPTKTYFAFAPTALPNTHSVTISKLTPGAPSDPSWGAKIPGASDFMTWAYFRQPALNLAVTRLRATADSFPALLNMALQVAQDTKCKSVEVWNVPEHLMDIARATGGETTERADLLSAFKWYGQQPDSKVDNEDVVWALDER